MLAKSRECLVSPVYDVPLSLVSWTDCLALDQGQSTMLPLSVHTANGPLRSAAARVQQLAQEAAGGATYLQGRLGSLALADLFGNHPRIAEVGV
jgi:hypothetical protein